MTLVYKICRPTEPFTLYPFMQVDFSTYHTHMTSNRFICILKNLRSLSTTIFCKNKGFVCFIHCYIPFKSANLEKELNKYLLIEQINEFHICHLLQTWASNVNSQCPSFSICLAKKERKPNLHSLFKVKWHYMLWGYLSRQYILMNNLCYFDSLARNYLHQHRFLALEFSYSNLFMSQFHPTKINDHHKYVFWKIK